MQSARSDPAIQTRQRVLGFFVIPKTKRLQGKLTAGIIQRQAAVVAVGYDPKNLRQPIAGLTELRESPPLSDQHIERADDPQTEHVGGDQRTEGHLLVEYRQRAHAHHQNGGRLRQRVAEVAVSIGRLRTSQGVGHRQRLDLAPARFHFSF